MTLTIDIDLSRLALLVCLVAVVTSAFVPAVGMAAAASTGDAAPAFQQQDAQTPTNETNTTTRDDTESNDAGSLSDTLSERGAELAISQESYVDNKVTRSQDGDRPVYRVAGANLDVAPQDFQPEDVVAAGVTTDVGSLSYNPDFGTYSLDPEGKEGSFDVYWIVDYDTPETEGTERTRFVATIQVVDGASVATVDPETLQGLRSDSRAYEDLNATLSEHREANYFLYSITGQPETNEDVFDGMESAYVETRNPGMWIFTSYRAVVTILVMSAGGYLVLLKFFGGVLPALRALKRRLYRHEINETYEGPLAERRAEQARKDRLETPANVDYNDIRAIDDVSASGWREIEETPTTLYARLRSETKYVQVARDRLRAMSQCGYAAQLSRDGDPLVTDGGDPETEAETDDEAEGDEEPSVEERLADDDVTAEIVELDDILGPDEQLSERDDLVSLESPSETLVDAVKTDSTIWNSFDPRTADYDPTELDPELETMSLEDIVEKLDPPMQYFESKEVFGRQLLAIVEWINQNYADSSGALDDTYFVMNRILQFEQEMADIHGVPGARARAEGIEAALSDYDPTAETDRYVKEVKQGAHT